MLDSSTKTHANGVTSQSTLALPQIKVLKLRISARWHRPESIPGPIVANVLRGALGLVFRKLVCPTEWFNNPCHPCPLYEKCYYGTLFHPKPAVLGDQLRNQQDAPRPFVIQPPGLAGENQVQTERIVFGLMLFGKAIDSLPLFVSTLERLGRDGLGRNRTSFDLEAIDAIHPAGNELLFGQKLRQLQVPSRLYTNEDLCLPVDSLTGSMVQSQSVNPRLRIQFLSPLLLKHGSYRDDSGRVIAASEVRQSPSFGILIRRLRDRLSSLCAFFGQRWEADFKQIGLLADQVQSLESRTSWLTRNRRSTRTGQSHEISGLIGWSIYQFPSNRLLQCFLPLLSIGELIHVGKNAPWGNGAIKCQVLNARCDEVWQHS